MVTKEDIIPYIQMLKETLSKNQIPICKAILFGSYAKGLAHPYSDIDIALVSEKFSGIRFFDIEKIIPYLRSLNPRIEVHPYRPEDFENSDNAFIQEIVTSGIEI